MLSQAADLVQKRAYAAKFAVPPGTGPTDCIERLQRKTNQKTKRGKHERKWPPSQVHDKVAHREERAKVTACVRYYLAVRSSIGTS